MRKTLRLLVLLCAFVTTTYAQGQNFPPSSGSVGPYPQTVSGSVNSGGIPCFTSSTQQSSSVLLTVNVYLKGGGAGACPTPGLTTDDGTTSTYTGTGGVSVTAGPLASTEISAPGGTASKEKQFGDSITHTWSYNSNNNGTSSFSGSWVCVNLTPVTVSAAVTTDQLLMACTIPAGTLNRLGRSLRIHLAGLYSTAASSTASISISAKLCTISGCGSGTVIVLVNSNTGAVTSHTASNNIWNYELVSTTQTAGATAAFEAHGNMVIDIPTGIASDSVVPDQNTATVGTIDTTAQLFLQVTGAFGAASASNSFTQRQMVLDTIN